MSNNDLELKFSADASGVAEGGAQAKSAVEGILAAVRGLTGTLLELGGAAQGSFRQIRAGATEAAESVKGASEAVIAMREAISGVAELFLAAFAVEQIKAFVEKLADASEQAVHTAQTFGLTVGEVQRMNAEAALFGVRGETLTTAMQRLDKAFSTAKQGGKQQAAAFKEMGISVQGAYTQTQLMNAALEGLAKMDAGPAKVAAAMAVFGRNIKEIGPLLGLTTEQIAEANTKITEYGAVNEVAAAKGLALAEQMNEGKVAGMGFKATLTDALAPALAVMVEGLNGLTREFVQSYNSGGAAKTVMEALDWTFKALSDTVGLFGTVVDWVFKTLDGAAWIAAGAMTSLQEKVVGDTHIMMDEFRTLGTIIADVFTGHWSQIEGDLHSGLSRITNDVTEASVKAGVAAAQGFEKGMQQWASGDQDVKNFEDWSRRLWMGADPKALPKQGSGTTAQDPGKTVKDKGPAEESQLQKWEAQLQDKKLAENNFWNDDLAGEKAFWVEKLGILESQHGATKAKEQQRLNEIRAIRQKIFTDSKALAVQERDETLANLGAEVKAQVDAETARYQVVKDGIAARIQATQQAARRGQIDPAEELARLKALSDEEIANEQAKIDAIYHINLQGLADKEALYAKDPINLHKVQAAELALTAAHQQQLTILEAKGAQDRRRLEELAATQTEAIWRQRVGGVVNAFGTQMQGLINMTQTWRGAMFAVLQAVESAAFQAAERIATNWIAGELAKTAASEGQSGLRKAAQALEALFGIGTSKSAAIAEVGASAAVAGAAGVASAAAIPLIGWEIAPAAGAADFAAAMSFAPAIAAAGGFDIPSGINPVVQAHQEEMILPATLANPLRRMLAANGNFGAPGAANQSHAPGAGATNVTHLHVHATDAPSVQRLFDNHGEALARTIERLGRDGRLRAPA